MKRALVFALAFLMLLTATPRAGAESVKELIENSVSFDGKIVTCRGEVIGTMLRDDKAWVNILENGHSIGIFCSRADAEKITFTGDYTHIGDNVEATGLFHFSCLEHGGDVDMHTDNLTVVAVGQTVERPPDALMVVLSSAFVSAAILIVFYLRRRTKEREKIKPWAWSG